MLFGGLIVIAGLVGLFVPVMPGLLLIIPGLALLAREFVWARRLLDRTQTQLGLIRPRSEAVGADERRSA